PKAPPVYRPEAKKIVQPKSAIPASQMKSTSPSQSRKRVSRGRAGLTTVQPKASPTAGASNVRSLAQTAAPGFDRKGPRLAPNQFGNTRSGAGNASRQTGAPAFPLRAGPIVARRVVQRSKSSSESSSESSVSSA